MKTAICSFCAQTGMLCKDCQNKLNTGQITAIDVQIAKTAIDFEKKHPTASKVTILKALENPKFILLLVSPGSVRLLTGGPLDFDKQLERILKKPVKIMEKGRNLRDTIDKIFSPALISGINTIFVPVRSPKPGQSSVVEQKIIVMPLAENAKLPGNIEELLELIKTISGEEIQIEFR